MDFENSLKILNLTYDLNHDDPDLLLKNAKHQYHKLALLYHPDKNINNPHATEQFRQINEAYEYIKTHIFNNLDPDDPPIPPPFSPKEYNQYIYQFLTTIYEKTPNQQQQTFADVLTALLTSCEKNVIPILQKYKSNQVLLFNLYQVLVKYKDIFYLSLEVLNKIEEFIKTTIDVSSGGVAAATDPRPFNTLLTPRFKDLMEGNVFYSRTYNIYIPLWALNTELCYDIADGDGDSSLHEIVFNCVFDGSTALTSSSPEIQSIHLDETLTHISLSVLLKMENIIDRDILVLDIDGVKILVEVDRIKLKKKQVITLVGGGIPIYKPDDVFNIETRGDIVILLELVL